MPDTLTTQVLIEQVQDGDQSALNELCSRYQMRVLTAVRVRLGAHLRQKVESWDIVQEAMIDALRGVEKFEFRTEGAFLKYINRVVANKIRDEADHWGAQRRDAGREVSLEKGRSVGSATPLITPEDRAAPTPSKIVGLHEDLALLESAMDRLGDESSDYRDLIVAAKIEGRTYREIAEESDSTEDAVRMRVKRALTALARIYKNLDGET
ncbi:MAG: sigma-70 family RNA polymerase sigma factor [Candidatus Nealsonbacteria bacterium]|nr:sigma-70 family RNA polymerase sigma factor [Candidatus Nealsonbacteria bacterium]